MLTNPGFGAWRWPGTFDRVYHTVQNHQVFRLEKDLTSYPFSDILYIVTRYYMKDVILNETESY